MNHALVLNALLIVACTCCVLVTRNPTFFLGLFFLESLPYALEQTKMQFGVEDEDGDESKPIGFTASVK